MSRYTAVNFTNDSTIEIRIFRSTLKGNEHWSSYLLLKILWIGTGITGMFQSTVFELLHIVFLISAIVSAVKLMRTKCENTDEMSEYNLNIAKAKTKDIMYAVYCVGSILSALVFGLLQGVGVSRSLPHIVVRSFFILMGIQDIATGVIFRCLEAE